MFCSNSEIFFESLQSWKSPFVRAVDQHIVPQRTFQLKKYSKTISWVMNSSSLFFWLALLMEKRTLSSVDEMNSCLNSENIKERSPYDAWLRRVNSYRVSYESIINDIQDINDFLAESMSRVYLSDWALINSESKDTSFAQAHPLYWNYVLII